MVAGFALVDHGGQRPPPPLKADMFYKADPVVPLYSLNAAKRDVYPLIGSASTVNLVKNEHTITLLPHKNQLATMNDKEQEENVKVVSTREHNRRHAQDSKARKAINPDEILAKVQTRARK